MTGALVVAKAPVAGLVKTRLGAEVGMERAAALAAAALLDTLRACTTAFGADRCVLALEGDLVSAVRSAELGSASRGWTVVAQRGDSFGERLRHAHADAHARLGEPVVQVGMDTPQAGPDLLRTAARGLVGPRAAVLGVALDGGWWLLGVTDISLLDGLDDVAMSTSQTGARTRELLERSGALIVEVEPLRDVDTVADAAAVASLAVGSSFAEAFG